jgi:hypothetical protein
MAWRAAVGLAGILLKQGIRRLVFIIAPMTVRNLRRHGTLEGAIGEIDEGLTEEQESSLLQGEDERAGLQPVCS